MKFPPQVGNHADMDSNWRARLDKLILARGYTRKSLSKAARFGETYLRDVIDLGRDPGVERLSAICELLGVSLSDLLYGDEIFVARVRVVGCVSAGENWTPIDDGDEFTEMTLPGGEPVGLEVRGDSMMPVYRPGDVLIGAKCVQASFQRLVGLDCIVLTKRGDRYVKFVAKSPARGRYNLRTYNPAFPDIENVEIEWAAPIVWVRRTQR